MTNQQRIMIAGILTAIAIGLAWACAGQQQAPCSEESSKRILECELRALVGCAVFEGDASPTGLVCTGNQVRDAVACERLCTR